MSRAEERLHKKGGGFLLESTPAEEVMTPEDFNEEQRMIAQTARDFMEKEVLPHAEKLEKQDFDLLRGLMQKAGELGLLGADVPEAYGGLGLDKVSSMLIAENVSVEGSFGATWGAHTGIGTLPIVFFGNEEQKQKYLPKLATGEWIGAYALTEPHAGSDAMNIKTKAVKSEDGQHWILTGQKQFITNAGLADIFTVFAKVDGEHFTGFLMERGTPGLTIGEEEKKMGVKGSSTRPLFLDKARIPVGNVLGEIGKGHRIAFGILNIGRYKLGVAAVGAAKKALQNAVQYASERTAFGRPIIQFPLIQQKIGRMALEIFVTESMAYRLAGLMDEALKLIDDPLKAVAEFAVESSILKVYGSEMLDFAVDETVQIYGGYGFIEEYPAARAYRDSRINRIWEGTNEINRMLIPGMLLRKAMKGELPLMPAVAKVASEVITYTPQPGTDDFGEELEALAVLKKITLMVAGLAAQKFGDALEEEQEILSALADLTMWVYGVESALLRVMKHHAGDELIRGMLRYYTGLRLKQAALVAEEILSSIKEGDELRMLFSALRKFTRWYLLPAGRDVLRGVARHVAERGAYPWSGY